MSYSDLSPEGHRARLLLLLRIYDRAMLDRWSLEWFEQLERDARALPQAPSAEEVESVFGRLVRAYLALSSAHLSGVDNRLDAIPEVDPEVRYWSEMFLSDFHARHGDAEIQRMYREGLDLGTGLPLPPGWLQLDVEEVREAESRAYETSLARASNDPA